MQYDAILRKIRYEEFPRTGGNTNTSVGSHEVEVLERREGQQTTECRKSYRRGSKLTEIV